MKSTLIITILTASLVAIMAVQAGTTPEVINVKNTPDVKKLQDGVFGISMNILLPCMQKQGKMDAAAEQKCFCDNKKKIQGNLKKLDKVLEKHPEWQGKTLHYKTGNESWNLELKHIEDHKKRLASCK